MSLRDMILSSDDLLKESVEVPEWGVTVEVRGMSGADRERILNSASDDGVKAGSMMLDVVIATVHDPDTGLPVFTPADRDALRGKAAGALDRLSTIGMRLSGMLAESGDDATKQFPAQPDEAPAV